MTITKILAIETSTNHGTVALLTDNELFVQNLESQSKHSASILPSITLLCDRAGLDLNSIEAIAYGKGPGSFTGIRLAHSVASALAIGLQRPLVPVSSLKALEYAAKSAGIQNPLPMLDARMGEIYVALDGREFLVAPKDLELSNTKLTAVGSGVTAYRQQLNNYLPTLELATTELYPEASAVAAIAKTMLAAGYSGANLEADLNYLRNDVATPRSKQ